MKLREIGEFGLIERVCRTAPKARGVRIGIGDDAAWVRDRFGSFLASTDLLIEGIHFDLRWTSLFALGYKTLAVNLSDIAAMGGVPAYLLLSLGIPADFRTHEIDEFYRGIRRLASQTGVALVGGDTSIADSLLISACIIGGAPYKPITRRGAKAGDDIYVTGTIGDSALGLHLLKRGSVGKTGQAEFLVSRHHQPTARLAVGSFLAREGLATAMIDVSDGLVQDLGHICKASGVGAVIWEDNVPLSAAYRKLAGNSGTKLALTGGEDYELLFCARPRDRTRITKIQQRTRTPVTRIGTCTASGTGVRVIDRAGKRVAVTFQGYDHFKNALRRCHTSRRGPTGCD
jgi:thiamine-monophosphate kinase